MGRYQSRSADYKIATRPFHFCLDEAAAPNDFPHSAFILDRTASIWRNEAYSCFFVVVFFWSFLPILTKSCVSSSSTSSKETTGTAEKTITTASYLANEAKISSKKCVWLQSVKLSHQYMNNCFANICTEECEGCYSETRSRSNVSGACTYWN